MSSSQPQQQQPATPPPATTLNRGIVKQVLSGDTVIIRGQPRGGPPPEKQLCLSGINARKLARRPVTNSDASGETKDEPYAWEAREFLRKKLVGKEITFTVDYKIPSGREYGCIYLGKDSTAENMTEVMVTEGLVEVRRSGFKPSEEQQRLIDLEEMAKVAGHGIWSRDAAKHVRDIKWNVENPRNFVDSLHRKPMKAVIEHVRDGSTIRAFLLPDFQYVTVMMSGIRSPMCRIGDDTAGQSEPFAEEAKFFTESRILQRDVDIILESVSNANFLGTILHPCGNIAELLLKEGFARCVDWSMAFVTGGMEKLRAAENLAKQQRVRTWKDYTPTVPQVAAKDREYVATVVEIVNADSIVVKKDDGTQKKIFLASVRPPRLQDTNTSEVPKEAKGRQFRPLYDIPFMYEAREFLRQKLIGKEVNVVVDYVQPPSDAFPEKTCCTVTISEINVAEVLVSKGFVSVVRYRQDDDMRSSQYDALLSAESKAQKNGNGMHGKTIPIRRIADVSGDSTKARQFFPFLQRAGRSAATVEYVGSGSRLRLYIPKETCLITFLLAGISCPRASRAATGGGSGPVGAEPFGEEALNFTRELCLQREVEVQVDGMDKVGNFIGWLWVHDKNLSVALVEEGLAYVHSTAERTVHYKSLEEAEEAAKLRKDKIWKDYEETNKFEDEEDPADRVVNYVSVVVTEICPGLRFYAQHVDQGPQLEDLMSKLREEFVSRPPLPGAYHPTQGDLCAAKFIDGLWYRAKVEKVVQDEATVLYVDYGNKEIIKISNLAILPRSFVGIAPAAHQYCLACVKFCKDSDFKQDVVRAFSDETQDQMLLLNVEYKVGSLEYVTLVDPKTKEDISRTLIADGLLLVEPRKELALQQLVMEYNGAQEEAKRKRMNLWEYGDITEDDTVEFGFTKN